MLNLLQMKMGAINYLLNLIIEKNIFNEYLSAVHMNITKNYFNKPIYVTGQIYFQVKFILT